MCGRGVRPDGVELAEAIEAELVDEPVRSLPARHNLAPTDPVGVLWRDAGRRRLSVARWGVERPRGGLAINARDDRLRGGMWRPMLMRGRAVVPLRGFYEWEGPQRQPWYFHRTDGGLLLLAGLVSVTLDALQTTIVTTTPSVDIGGVHDRMPAILEPDMVDPWLAGRDDAMLADLVRTAPEGTLRRHPVSRDVNSVRNDGAHLIEPAAPEPTQVDLF
ncbi:MAG: SOS response-associated peptidase [Deltaproteobacteria bacterium]|nr:SOS response-associated peptidase [Deltaproteobacteria bacterium]